MRMFFSGILLLNTLKSNMQKLKKYNSEEKFFRKFVFHKTEKSEVSDFNREPILKNIGKGMMNILLLGVYI